MSGIDPEGLWTVIYINIFAYTTPQGWIALGIITVGTIGYEVYKYWDDFGICYSKGGKQNIDNEYVREVQRLGLRGGDICSYLKRIKGETTSPLIRRKIKIAEKRFNCDNQK